jgi:predicted  nucleic acid-binding Zn-ribbon protein
MPSQNDSHENDVDKAGEALLRLLHKSADALEQDHRQALERAQRIGDQVRAARDRIAELERDIADHRERADRAEEWLKKIQNEITEQFPQGSRSR